MLKSEEKFFTPKPVHNEFHLKRRRKLAKWMLENTNGESSLAIFYSGSEKVRNRDNYYPFRSSSDFYYLTGFPEPNSWLIISCNKNNNFSDTIFCLTKDPLQELWNGIRVGPEKAKADFFFHNSYTTEKLKEIVEKEFNSVQNLFFPFSHSKKLDKLVKKSFVQLNKQGRGKKIPPKKLLMPLRYWLNFVWLKIQKKLTA